MPNRSLTWRHGDQSGAHGSGEDRDHRPMTSSMQVEATFLGRPPAVQVGQASGVSQVKVEGAVLRCVVSGSFQPFLEALRGHEVISFSSVPADLIGGPSAR